MDEEAVFQTAFFLKEFLYTEKKTLEFSENTKVFLENSKVFSEKMKEFFRTIPYDKYVSHQAIVIQIITFPISVKHTFSLLVSRNARHL